MVVEVQGVPPKLPYATLIHFLGMGVAGWGVTPRPKDKYFVGATSPPPHSDPTRTLAYEVLRIP